MIQNMIRAGLSIAVVVFFAGCSKPQIDDAHLLMNPQEQQMTQQTQLGPGVGEADVVEQLSAARSSYKAALEELIAYYVSTGNAAKQRWAQNELNTLMQTAQYRYLMPGEYVTKNMSATENISGAEDMYKKAMQLYSEAGGYLIITDAAKFREALQWFNKLISEYPNSTRIDEAAYRAGRIYEYFKDYELAAVMYQRCFQWNENTSFPARFRAAEVMDYRLKMRKEALAMYKLTVQKESRYTDNVEIAKQRIMELSKADVQLEKEAESVLKQ